MPIDPQVLTRRRQGAITFHNHPSGETGVNGVRALDISYAEKYRAAQLEAERAQAIQDAIASTIYRESGRRAKDSTYLIVSLIP